MMGTWGRWLVLAGWIGCAGGRLVDDPCDRAGQCELVYAECVDIADGIDRCQAVCQRDTECGPLGECLFDTVEEEFGLCWRACDTPADCAEGAWDCVALLQTGIQTYCVPRSDTTKGQDG